MIYQHPQETNRLLKLPEAARILNVSRTQAYRLAQTGELPSVRFGKCVRIRPADLDEFIEKNLKGA